MMTWKTLSQKAAMATVIIIPLVLVTGCGPVTPTTSPTTTPTSETSASPTPTATPTPAKSQDQIAAEEKVLEMNRIYWSVISGGDPNALYQVIRNRDEGMEGYVASYFKIYSQTVGAGLKAEGDRPVAIVDSTPTEADGRVAVFVDTCIDNRTWSFVDPKGKKVPLANDLESVRFEVQQWPDGDWYVVGEQDGEHRCDAP